MNLPDDLLPGGLLWWAHLLFLPILLFAARYAPWHLLQAGFRQNVFLAACVALMLLWSLSAGMTPGLQFHYLGATVMVLMFGWHLAIVGLTLVLAGVTLFGQSGVETFSLNALLMAVVPATVSLLVLRVVERWLPTHFFVYVYLCGFGAAVLAMGATVALVIGTLHWAGVYELGRIGYEYGVYVPLMVLTEGFFNGMLITALVVYRPDWVITFDDARYIEGK
ncbi:energy-coupling factor ABC transporter permease [Ectothiorhodospiraceae bacterium 2226]|nr:energy-coupling factor ABC transporter permease [Ectothiorhodospiraceae bacterium 2226]